MPGILQCYIGQQWGNLKPSMEKMGLTMMFDSSLQQQATRKSSQHHNSEHMEKEYQATQEKVQVLRLLNQAEL